MLVENARQIALAPGDVAQTENGPPAGCPAIGLHMPARPGLEELAERPPIRKQGVEPPFELPRGHRVEPRTELEQVRITDLQEGTFFAELIFDGGVKVSARPSDSVALALRVGVPIHAEESVLAEAGLVIPDEQEDEVEKFREFLDSISPEDFRGAR